MRACPVFCVSVLQVGVDSVGVRGGELGQGRALSRVVGHGASLHGGCQRSGWGLFGVGGWGPGP